MECRRVGVPRVVHDGYPGWCLPVCHGVRVLGSGVRVLGSGVRVLGSSVLGSSVLGSSVLGLNDLGLNDLGLRDLAPETWLQRPVDLAPETR